MDDSDAARRAFPRLPVLGWAAFSGPREAHLPGVLDARYRLHALSGRAAIGLALRLLGVSAGDKVLVPTYHCPTMIAPVAQAGAQPVFYPITAAGAPDLAWLERAELAGVRALLVAHYFGLPQPMAAARAFCDANGIALIEDCAHAFFGVSGDRPVGGWGDAAVASLTKFFPVPDGGLIVSASRPLTGLELARRGCLSEVKAAADAIELGARYRRFAGLNAVLGCAFGIKKRIFYRNGAAVTGDRSGSGPAAPLSDPLLLAARPAVATRCIVASVHQQRIVEARRRNYADLARLLSGLRGARPLQRDLPDGAAPYVFPLCIDDPAAAYPRVRAAGIPVFRWDELWPGTPTIAGDHGADWSTHVFQLGCHQDLEPEDIEAMAAAIRDIIQTR